MSGSRLPDDDLSSAVATTQTGNNTHTTIDGFRSRLVNQLRRCGVPEVQFGGCSDAAVASPSVVLRL